MVEDQKHGVERDLLQERASGGIASPSDAGWFAEPIGDQIEVFGYATT